MSTALPLAAAELLLLALLLLLLLLLQPTAAKAIAAKAAIAVVRLMGYLLLSLIWLARLPRILVWRMSPHAPWPALSLAGPSWAVLRGMAGSRPELSAFSRLSPSGALVGLGNGLRSSERDRHPPPQWFRSKLGAIRPS